MDRVPEVDHRPVLQEPAPIAAASEPGATETPEERLAVMREVVPLTLRSLYMLRISLYSLAAVTTLAKIILSPTVSSFLLDLVTDSIPGRALLDSWVHALQLLVCGLLAGSLALVIATFFIQARLLSMAKREGRQPGEFALPGTGAALIAGILEREVAIALVTGVLTFGTSELLARGATGTATTFALLAAVAAGALDTLFFHLLFLLREAPVHASEQHYRQGIELAQRRLAEGSIRLQEALIGRFEADYQRTAVAHRSAGRSRRQLREARRQMKLRLWVIDRVVPRNQLVAFSAQAKTDPDLLERWTEEVDWLVNARSEVERRQSFASRLTCLVRPAELARLTIEERHRFAAAA